MLFRDHHARWLTADEQTWVDTNGTHVLINSVDGHQKLRTVQRDPRVTLSVLDPAQWERAIMFRGRVVEIIKEGAEPHFKQLVERYLGQEEYRYGQSGQVRIRLEDLP